MEHGEVPGLSKTPHGTRSRYVRGCRCEECRKANREYSQERAKRLIELALPVKRKTKTAIVERESVLEVPYYRLNTRMCVGRNGKGCPWKCYLRKDSKGDLCNHCREGLLRRKKLTTLVPAKKSREHILELSKLGIGYKAVADAAKVSRTVVMKIRKGTKKHVKLTTERRILAVDLSCMANHALVSAKETWKLIRWMLGPGLLTKYELNERLGTPRYGMPQIRKDKVLSKTAFLVKKLYFEVKEELEEARTMKDYCPECGREHTPAARYEDLMKLLPVTVEELRQRRSCWWGGGPKSKGERTLYRDLTAVGAVKQGATWYLPRTGAKGRDDHHERDGAGDGMPGADGAEGAHDLGLSLHGPSAVSTVEGGGGGTSDRVEERAALR